MYILRQHRSGDIGWVIQQHGLLYAKEHGWDARFEAFVARIAADFIDTYDPARERCWIAECDGEPLGCVFLVKHRELADTAQLRMLLVTPAGGGWVWGKRWWRSVPGSREMRAIRKSCSGPTAF